MARRDFIHKQQAMTRQANRRLGVWGALFFAALFGMIPLTGYIERHEQDYRWIGTISGIGLGVFLLGNLALLLWYGTKQQKQFGHRCPHCKKALLGFMAHLAIATGNCGYCGTAVFEESLLEQPSKGQ